MLDIVQSWVPLNLCNSLPFMVHKDAWLFKTACHWSQSWGTSSPYFLLLLLLPLALQPIVGFGLSNNVPPLCPICHQLSPSSHSQHLKISFGFFSPSFPGPSSSFRPFQFLREDLFGHPILLHSFQVTQPTYPLPHYTFYFIFSFIHLFQFSIRPTFPFFIFIFTTIYSSKYFPFEN